MNDRAVRHRVATGRLYRSHPGVYLLEPPESTSRLALFAAAVAACGPGALISHHAAAELWGLLPPQRGDIDVTVLGRNPGKRDGVRIHRTQALQRRDIRTRQGLPTSAPARVILELAPRLDGEHLENLIATAGRELKVTETEIFAVLERYPAYPGAGRVRAVLRRAGGPSLTRSKAERLLLSLIRRAGLPAPATNVRTGRGELDFRWPAERLVVEVDGFEFHGDRASFERDRRRDAELVAGGWRVIRFTWRQLTEEPFMVIARIAQALAR